MIVSLWKPILSRPPYVNAAAIGDDVAQSQIPAVDFVHKYEHVFAFKLVILYSCSTFTESCMYSQTFLAQLDNVAAMCNFTDYMRKYVTYPPHGPLPGLPLPGTSLDFDVECDVWDMIYNASQFVNPAFNIYHILDTVSALIDLHGRLIRSCTGHPMGCIGIPVDISPFFHP